METLYLKAIFCKLQIDHHAISYHLSHLFWKNWQVNAAVTQLSKMPFNIKFKEKPLSGTSFLKEDLDKLHSVFSLKGLSKNSAQVSELHLIKETEWASVELKVH